MEFKFDILTVHVLHIEILLIPVVLMFYVLMGLIIDIQILLKTGILLVVAYFILRFIGKSVITYYSCKFSSLEPDISRNLHLSLITQAGIALSLSGLAYNQLISLNFIEEAKLLVTVIGVSIILSQLVGPVMLRFAIERCTSEKAKFTLLSAVDDSP
jgi:NhaP-type Na+/H+ or K+/H+ antiporter